MTFPNRNVMMMPMNTFSAVSNVNLVGHPSWNWSFYSLISFNINSIHPRWESLLWSSSTFLPRITAVGITGLYIHLYFFLDERYLYWLCDGSNEIRSWPLTVTSAFASQIHVDITHKPVMSLMMIIRMQTHNWKKVSNVMDWSREVKSVMRVHT